MGLMALFMLLMAMAALFAGAGHAVPMARGALTSLPANYPKPVTKTNTIKPNVGVKVNAAASSQLTIGSRKLGALKKTIKAFNEIVDAVNAVSNMYAIVKELKASGKDN